MQTQTEQKTKQQTEQELLQQAEKSPQAVSVHDKAAWLEVFATQSMIEDPVGSRPHIAGVYDATSGQRGKAQLARFYETFIAPNSIRFDVHRDIVSGSHVMRDLDIHIQMADKVHLKVPMHLLYHLVQQDGEWKITRLAAHWELIPMVMQLMGNGMASLPVSLGLSARMLKYQGILGMLAYSKAVLNVGKRGKQQAQTLVQSLNARNTTQALASFADHATVSWQNMAQDTKQSMKQNSGVRNSGDRYAAEQFVPEYNWQIHATDKWIAAGDTVTATVRLEKDDTTQHGVALFRFNRKAGKIQHLHLYCA